MEYEKDANFSNFTFDEDITPAASMAFIAHEIIFTIFEIIGMFADIAIIYVIFRFQRMRKLENILLGNWAIADFGSLLLAPSGFRILSIMDSLPISPEFMCTLFHSGQILQITVIMFAVLISIDWLLGVYWEKTSEKFRKYFKYYIGAIWIFTVLFCSVATGYCLHEMYTFSTVFTFIGVFFLVLIITLVLQISRAARKFCLKRPIEHPSLLLNIATALPGTYILAVIMLVLVNTVRLHPLIGIIGEIFIFCNSIVNLVLLYNYNKDFQACFIQALRRGDKYEETGLSFDNPLANKVYDKCSVPIRISFNDNAELINTECY
ncbi:hypothetical protein ILUMI_13920 [Ignelater luminosus]|uniref:G-protein coupled receptors family 1 profile domain-containing protein n=1 Tax=Ignelater luminosus TaxID=2038154 RepID=A0A8K0CRG4_IGNLU|nr:hypothetical protein ILUMI_13920 [Ignelater luminosus]